MDGEIPVVPGLSAPTGDHLHGEIAVRREGQRVLMTEGDAAAIWDRMVMRSASVSFGANVISVINRRIVSYTCVAGLAALRAAT
jgi:hypothetical protein